MAFRKIINSEGGQKFVTEQEEELVFDQNPTKGSFNPLTSDGVAKAIEGIENGYSEIRLDVLNGLGVATVPTTDTAQQALKIFKKINFYNSAHVEGTTYCITALFRHTGLSLIRINVTPYVGGESGVTYSFVCHDPDPSSTGVQHYVLESDPDSRQLLEVDIDWNEYDGTLLNIQGFEITQKYYDMYSVGHSLDETWQNQNLGYQTLAPVRKITADGVIQQVSVDVGSSGTAYILVGTISPSLIFSERARYEISVTSGANVIDVSERGICVFNGESVAFGFNGTRKLFVSDGTPDSQSSYYYSTYAPQQLERYGIATKQIAFAFNFVVSTDEAAKTRCREYMLSRALSYTNESVSVLQNTSNVFKDTNGNRYVLEIVDGSVVAELLDFRHILVVGNSYTVHPTTSDDRPALATTYWWGHWSMAASTKDVTWITMLKDTLEAKYGSDVDVYPIFGRPYEQGGGINADDSFVYWDSNNDVQDFVPDIENFSNTDCVVLFLGENYTGNDIRSWYTALITKFRTLFPGRMIYCVGSRASASKSEAIAEVAAQYNCRYIDMLNKGLSTKVGAYVLGDDNNLHQIDNSAVASHPGDSGQIELAETIMNGLSIEHNITSYSVNVADNRLSVMGSKFPAGAIISVFGDVNSVSVNSGAVVVTPHLATDYGNVFTFEMPAANVTVSVG